MRVSSQTGRTNKPPIDFAAVSSKRSLSDLIRTLAATKAAAEAACTAQSRAEEKHRGADGKLARPARPKVYGGMTEVMVIMVGEKRTEQPAHEWFYSSREEIEKSGTPEQLADWDQQEKVNAKAYPKEIKAAERAALKALDAWTAAEHALTRYRPQSIAEAADLLALADAPHKSGALFLEVGEEGLQAIAGNCAKALREALDN